jgi:hypothetical protein
MNTQDKLKAAIAIYEKDFQKNAMTVRGGKKYGTVNQRLKAFRMYFPDASITIDVIKNERVQVKNLETEVVVMKCSISIDGKTVSTGIAEEFREGSAPVNVTSFWEVCETSAIGRSLANLGFSGQEFASYDEIQIAEAKSQTIKNSGTTADKPKDELLSLHEFTAAVNQAQRSYHLDEVVTKYKSWLGSLSEEDVKTARSIYNKKLEELNTMKKGKHLHE